MNWSLQMRLSALALTGVAILLQSVAIAGDNKEGSAIRDKYVLKEEPRDAKDVIATRDKAKDKDDVVVVGRIGGRVNPWVKGTAAFSIVDLSMKPCNEREGDTCKTPWDYCCEADLPKATLFVTILDDKTGNTLKQDARETFQLKELQTLVVQGKARRDAKGNVMIAASHIFIRPEKEASK
jgi:hypothetical protein